MGLECTLVSEYYAGNLPDWFKEEYSGILSYPCGILIASNSGVKLTKLERHGNELFEDYRTALIETGFFDNFDNIDFKVSVIVLSEDGDVSKALIGKDGVEYLWFDDYSESDRILP